MIDLPMKLLRKVCAKATVQIFLFPMLAAASALVHADDLVAPRMTAEYRAHHCIFSKYGRLTENSPSTVIANYQREASDKPLVIYFHGGLVTQDTGTREAAVLSANGLTADVCYPVFMIWNSDVTTELLNQDPLPRSMRANGIKRLSPTRDSDATKTALSWTQAVCTHVWDGCKVDISDAFNLPSHRGVGAQLVSAIARHHVKNRIVLVGHSAGALYILEFLEAARTALPDTEFDVVFLAPACSYAFVAGKLMEWSNDGYHPIHSFRMFSLSDEAERRDRIISDIQLSNLISPIVSPLQESLATLFPWSILYLVSKNLEHQPNTPLLGMQRYFDEPTAPADWGHDLTIFSLFRNAGDNVVCPAPRAPLGYRSEAMKHSGFFEDALSRESLHAIAAGVAADPERSQDAIHVQADSLPTQAQGYSNPRRHFAVMRTDGALSIDLDQLGFVDAPNANAQRSAYGEFTCSAFPSSTNANTLSCTLPIRVYKTAGCTVTVHLSVNGIETSQELPDAMGQRGFAQVVNLSVEAPLGSDPVKGSVSLTVNPAATRVNGAFACVAAGSLTVTATNRSPLVAAITRFRANINRNMEAWVFDGVFALLFFWWPVRRLVRLFPRVPAEAGGEFPTLEVNQAEYLRRARWGTVVACAMPIAAIYLWFRVFSGDNSDSWSNSLVAAGLALSVAVGNIVGVFWYRAAAAKLVASRPEFAESRGGTMAGIHAAGLISLPCTLFAIGAFVGGETALLCGYAAAAVSYVVLTKIVVRRLVKMQDPISPESPLGEAITEMLAKAGIEPKRLVRVRSFLANGFALPDGTITVTTMLAANSKEREVAAVLAHELSHSLDKDPKRLKRALLFAMSPWMLLAVVGGGLLGGYHAQGPYMVSAIVATVLSASRPIAFMVSADYASVGIQVRQLTPPSLATNLI